MVELPFMAIKKAMLTFQSPNLFVNGNTIFKNKFVRNLKLLLSIFWFGQTWNCDLLIN